VSGDQLLDQSVIGRAFKEGAKEFYDDFNENDKHTMAVILKQSAQLAFECIGRDQEFFDRELFILKGSFSNLTAHIQDKAIAKTFEIIGKSVAMVGAGFLKQAMG